LSLILNTEVLNPLGFPRARNIFYYHEVILGDSFRVGTGGDQRDQILMRGLKLSAPISHPPEMDT
jgi:hypothetical protein